MKMLCSTFERWLKTPCLKIVTFLTPQPPTLLFLIYVMSLRDIALQSQQHSTTYSRIVLQYSRASVDRGLACLPFLQEGSRSCARWRRTQGKHGQISRPGGASCSSDRVPSPSMTQGCSDWESEVGVSTRQGAYSMSKSPLITLARNNGNRLSFSGRCSIERLLRCLWLIDQKIGTIMRDLYLPLFLLLLLHLLLLSPPSLSPYCCELVWCLPEAISAV